MSIKSLRCLLAFLTALMVFPAVRAQHARAEYAQCLFPAPQEIHYGQGNFALTDLSIHVPAMASKEVLFALLELKKIITERTKRPVKTVASSSAASFRILVKSSGLALPGTRDEAADSTAREYYRIDITAGNLAVTANTSAGLYYAVQTLRQLIRGSGREATLPQVSIKDWPALPRRGIMMDFAHGSLLTVEEIKRQIDFLARWKTNQYYFYNEVSIALKGVPTLNFQASYSQEQIKELIAYAREKHMDLIPFVAFYGHLHELVRNEKYAALAIGKYGHELNPANPAVKVLLKDWIKQYVELFEGPYIHVGFDETWETNRISQDKDSTIHSEDLWLAHLGFVQKELKKYGKTVLAWTDMNSYYPDVLSRFPRDVTPVIWEYAPDSNALHHYLDPVLKEKRSFFIQPAVSGWGHVYPAARYTYDNIDLCLRAGMRYHTLGFITSVWTDAVEPFIRCSWPFMAYGSIGAWQGCVSNRDSFEAAYARIVYPAVQEDMKQAFYCMAKAGESLAKCLGRNTGNMPGGTFVESWLNPFSAYYLQLTKEHTGDLRETRRWSEEAEAHLENALLRSDGKDSSLIFSLLVSARLVNYSATRFVWARNICDRWSESMLDKKKNDFVYYDISYTCHGLLVDLMNETGELKDAYAKAWLSENAAYRLNTMLGKFDVEMAFWQKLSLKIQTYKIEHPGDYVATSSFEETFKPDF